LLFKLLFCPPKVSDGRQVQDFLFMDDYSFIVKSNNLEELQRKTQHYLDELGFFFDDHNITHQP
jgi:hypothetical protein